ncbi:polymorphic toxin type 15 domain-containing protein, partial [Rhizobium sp. UGM030330-04]
MPTKSTIDLDEFKRQMELQEQGLNNMSPQQMLANQAKYLANPAGMRALSEPLQAKARQEYRNDP